MKSLTILLSMSLATVNGLPAGEPPAKAKAAATEIILPRFDEGTGEVERNPKLRKALEAIPTLKTRGDLFPYGFLHRGKKAHISGHTLRIEFDPSTTDVGGVVKAVAAVPGPERRKHLAAAILMVRTDSREGLKPEQLEALWTHLAKIKGVDVETSRQLKHSGILGIAMDDTGNARLRDIVEAVETTGAKVRDPRELD